MGGCGSGRRGGAPTADASLRIDIAWMLRTGRAVSGQQVRGSLAWTCRGEPSGNIAYVCDMRDPERGELELRFTVIDHRQNSRRHYVQRITMSYTRPHFGGKRWWLHCPFDGKRVGKLYCPSGADTFASRTAYRLAYESQRIADRDRPFEALFRLQKRLGCQQGWEQPIRRPKGMWRRTYARLEKQFWELDAQCAVQMIGVLAKFGDFPSLKNRG